MPQLSANDQSKFQTNDATVTPMKKKLQSIGVNFSTKKTDDTATDAASNTGTATTVADETVHTLTLKKQQTFYFP